ncbi:MAG: ATP-binding protein, partial [Actinomycetes bacterium]
MGVDQELFADRLPTYLTRFVGRKAEFAELRARLARARLLTICGVGGLGKTRLAIELAKSLRGRPGPPSVREAYWVALGSVVDPAEVAAAVAAGIGVPGVGAQALVAALNALRHRHALVLLDNCEQVASACAEVARALVHECPRVVLVATSRIPLGVAEEEVYAVPPMGEEAVDLFVDRATSVAPAYALTEHNAESIGAICTRLNGLPLAIELTASWVRAVSPRDLLGQLEQTTHASPPGAAVAERHRNLTAVLDGTWQWLGEEDRAVATALGVFRGGFTREAAEDVAGASLASLATLTERALVQRLPDAVGGSRYQLHELVRSYAVKRLEAAGPEVADRIRSRHFDYYLRMAEGFDTPEHTAIEPTLDGPLAAEQGNVDAAMSWALSRADAERALRIGDAFAG